MSGWLVVLAAVSGWLAGLALEAFWRLADWWTVRCGRPRVRVVVEQATARHVTRLVPGQRRPADLPPWADLLDQRDRDGQ